MKTKTSKKKKTPVSRTDKAVGSGALFGSLVSFLRWQARNPPDAPRKLPAALTTDELVSRCLRLQVENHALREAGGLMRAWIGNNETAITERWDSALPNAQAEPRA